MPKRSRKPKNDVNQAAKAIVDALTGQGDEEPQKNPAAVILGRLGGLKGGRARAKKLSKARRTEIAKKAAQKRWKNKS